MKNFFAVIIFGILIIPIALQAGVTSASTPITAPITLPITSPIITPVSYVLSGKITLVTLIKKVQTVTPMENVKVTVTDVKSNNKVTVATKKDGTYTVVLSKGTYLVVPEQKNKFFLPLFQLVTIKNQNDLNVNFQAVSSGK